MGGRTGRRIACREAFLERLVDRGGIRIGRQRLGGLLILPARGRRLGLGLHRRYSSSEARKACRAARRTVSDDRTACGGFRFRGGRNLREEVMRMKLALLTPLAALALVGCGQIGA